MPQPTQSLPEYTRCVESRGGSEITIVHYKRDEWAGDGYLGPYHVFAEYVTSSGRLLQAYASAKSLDVMESLVASLRTVTVREQE